MVDTAPEHHTDDFLGSVNIFSTAIHELLERQLTLVAKNRITFSQLKLLNLISRTEGHTIGDVAAFLGVSNAAASKAVDRLVRRQLLLREEAATDRRAVRLSVTEAGRQILANYDGAAIKALRSVFGSIPTDRLRETAALLDELSMSIVKGDDGDDAVCFRCGIHFREKCLLRQTTGRACYLHHHKRPAVKQSAGA
jgi:DNA-binding MarR family transcriptional regulator